MPKADKSEEKKTKENGSAKASNPQKLYRSESDKVIAGVAGGLGEFFNIDSTIVRIIFILLAVFGGSGLIIYLVLWLVMPSKSSTEVLTSDAIKSNIEDIKSTTKKFAHDIQGDLKTHKRSENSKFTWAILIIILGFLFLLNNYGVLDSLELDRLWPLILIFFGLAIILRK